MSRPCARRPALRGRPGRSRGFTLMELLIVMVVVGILAAIAIPSYNEQVRRTRRTEATTRLLEMAQALERWHTVNRTYANPASAPNHPCTGLNTDPQRFYDLSCPTLTATQFALQAAPRQAQTADKCGTLTYDQAGRKGVTGAASGVTAADCW